MLLKTGSMDNLKILETEKISKLIMKFSLPAIVGMIVFASYNLVDRFFVGRGVGPLAISAITVAFPMMIIFGAFGMLVGVGATALISIKLGEKNKDEAEKILGNAFLLSIILSIILSFLGYLIMTPALILFGGTGEVLKYAEEYLFIIILGTVFQTITFVNNAMIRGEGNPRMAMFTILISGILNIILNPIFIFWFHLGIKGSASATFVSQVIGSIWVTQYFLNGRGVLKLHFKNMKLQKNIILGIFSIGMSPFAMQIAGSVVTILFNNSLLKYGGDLAIAAMGIGNSLIMFLLMPIFGLNQGIQPIFGYNFGAKQYKRVKRTLKLSVYLASLTCFVGFLVIIIFSEKILMVFSGNNLELVDIGAHGLRIIVLMLPAVGFQIISANFFQSIGKAQKSLIITLSRQVLVLIPLLLILPPIFKLNGIWMSAPIADAISGIIAYVFILGEVKKLKEITN
jgi:putative MATE family efflux protein